ncbi:MAG: M1 family aminopeptidase, partial [bacterium]|nr:M1 family aminopeptidase [bacterium]
LYVSDIVTLSAPVDGEFSFTLNKDLEIGEIYVGTSLIEFERAPYGGEGVGETEEWATVDTVMVNLPAETSSFQLTYTGIINVPIDPGTSLGRVRGDYTSGIISEDGVYLSSETGWYPDTAYSMATYDIVVITPEGWYPVTQGNLTGSEVNETNGFRTTTWSSAIPSDGCVLVANQYFVTSRTIDGVVCSTYFYQDDPDLTATFLDKLEQYLPAYTELFGPYPYSRFDVVENFFSTGYGMPGFTLLGSMVLRMPYAAAEGSLAHELVHNWWGNYVYVDWETGNWCEGLTFFSTNYYWNILDGRPDDARAFRYRSMVRYSSEVSPDEDYPIRQFRTKMTAVDGDIGYDKTSAFFIMLHEMLGKDKFFEALRLGVERYGGHKTSWDDWKAVFEEVSGLDLTNFFTSWLDQAGAPELQLSDISSEQTDAGYRVVFNINQTGNQFNFDLNSVLSTSITEADVKAPMTGLEQHIELLVTGKPISLQLDPDYFVFRHLTRDEIPPSLKTTLEADSLIVVLPSSGTDEILQMPTMGHGGMGGGAPTEMTVGDLFESVANEIVGSGLNVVIKDDTEVTDADLRNSSILCLGAPRNNSLVAQIGPDITQPLEFLENGFAVNGTEYSEAGNSILASVRNPYNPDRDITFYMGNSPQAMFKASYIFFYNWDSWVTYLDGTVVNRGDWDMGAGPLYYEFE